MKNKKSVSKVKPLTISEWRTIHRRQSILLTRQEEQIKDMLEEILYLRNRPLEVENKKLSAENKALLYRIHDEQMIQINAKHKELGIPPLGFKNPSEIYLSVSK